MNNFRDILKINWFIYKAKEYKRDDWMQIISQRDDWYTVVFPDWNTLDIDNKAELIGSLAIHNIINRLY